MNELARDVFNQKYGKIEYGGTITPNMLWRKEAEEFARIEHKFIQQIDPDKELQLSDYGWERLDRLKQIGCEGIAIYFYQFFKDFRYIVPGGSVMDGITSSKPVSLSNCFVNQSPEDSINSIYNQMRDNAQIFKRRGGVGIDMSTLRPSGAKANNAAGTSRGPMPFIKEYCQNVISIGQDGRRGALMITMDVNHPDILDFIKAKRDTSEYTGANFSVKLNEEFIAKAHNNEDYLLRFPCDMTPEGCTCNYLLEDYCSEYNRLYKGSNQYFKKVKAKEIWDAIVESAWMTGEPGILLWDNMINRDPTSVYLLLKATCTNPCGELALAPYDSCRLISVNLYSMVEKPFTAEAAINWDGAYNVFYEQQCLADNLVELEIEAIDRIIKRLRDAEHYCEEELNLWRKIRSQAVGGRRTGCGIFGYADMLAALGLPYDMEANKETWVVTDKLFRIKAKAELTASIDLAIMRGTFPLYDRDNEWYDDDGVLTGKNEWYKNLAIQNEDLAKRMQVHGRRNAGLSTIPPTGTVSIIAETTSGIEPLFQPFYKRRVKVNGQGECDFTDVDGQKFKEYLVIHPKLIDWLCITSFGGNYESKEFQDRLKDEDYMKRAFEDSPYYGQCAADIPAMSRISTQSLMQDYITSSISSTINLPNSAPKELINDIYNEAVLCGLKGITVYRDGCRAGILVSNSRNRNDASKRPKELDGDMYHKKINGHPYVIVVGLLDKKPYELFIYDATNIVKGTADVYKGKIIKIKKGHYRWEAPSMTIDSLSENRNTDDNIIALYTSMLLRHNVPLEYVINMIFRTSKSISSMQAAIGRILSNYSTEVIKEVCPECGGEVINEGGCKHCLSCSYSKCQG